MCVYMFGLVTLWPKSVDTEPEPKPHLLLIFLLILALLHFYSLIYLSFRCPSPLALFFLLSFPLVLTYAGALCLQMLMDCCNALHLVNKHTGFKAWACHRFVFPLLPELSALQGIHACYMRSQIFMHVNIFSNYICSQ